MQEIVMPREINSIGLPNERAFQNPCEWVGGKASFAVTGICPDRNGGGVIAWAYSREEAEGLANRSRELGYHGVKVEVKI